MAYKNLTKELPIYLINIKLNHNSSLLTKVHPPRCAFDSSTILCISNTFPSICVFILIFLFGFGIGNSLLTTTSQLTS